MPIRTSNVFRFHGFHSMGLLPDTQNCGCACAGNAGNVFPATVGKRSRHASRHVCDARAVMHAWIANWRFPLKSAAGETFPAFPVHAQTTISRICQEAHGRCHSDFGKSGTVSKMVGHVSPRSMVSLCERSTDWIHSDPELSSAFRAVVWVSTHYKIKKQEFIYHYDVNLFVLYSKPDLKHNDITPRHILFINSVTAPLPAFIKPRVTMCSSVQDCSNPIANTPDLLQTCTETSIWWFHNDLAYLILNSL